MNPSGKYNLNFIDWENEFDAVCEAEENIANGDDPIYGMDAETYESLINDELYDDITRLYGVRQEFYEKFPIMEAVKDSDTNMCAICIKHYSKGDKVFFLPCSHNFHIECIMPWFKTNNKCPTCRYDLNEGKAESESGEDEIEDI